MLPGILRYESGIDLNDDIVMMTTKGEAIAIGELFLILTTVIVHSHVIIYQKLDLVFISGHFHEVGRAKIYGHGSKGQIRNKPIIHKN